MTVDRSRWSLKRLAWAYGVSKAGTPEERELLEALLAKARRKP